MIDRGLLVCAVRRNLVVVCRRLARVLVKKTNWEENWRRSSLEERTPPSKSTLAH